MCYDISFLIYYYNILWTPRNDFSERNGDSEMKSVLDFFFVFRKQAEGRTILSRNSSIFKENIPIQ